MWSTAAMGICVASSRATLGRAPSAPAAVRQGPAVMTERLMTGNIPHRGRSLAAVGSATPTRRARSLSGCRYGERGCPPRIANAARGPFSDGLCTGVRAFVSGYPVAGARPGG
jgi:hypothetical protein